MPGRVTKRSLKELVETALQRDNADIATNPVERWLVKSANFIPHGIPLSHPVREMNDDRAYTDDAPLGFWDVSIWDIDNDSMPIARAAFVKTRGLILCDRLSVEPAYRGYGLGRRLIDLGQRLWGGAVEGASGFYDEQESFWCSEPSLTWT